MELVYSRHFCFFCVFSCLHQSVLCCPQLCLTVNWVNFIVLTVVLEARTPWVFSVLKKETVNMSFESCFVEKSIKKEDN